MIENEYKWFLTNYSDLFKEYGDSFLAIKDEAVLGTYSSYADGVWKRLKTRNWELLLSRNAMVTNLPIQIMSLMTYAYSMGFVLIEVVDQSNIIMV